MESPMEMVRQWSPTDQRRIAQARVLHGLGSASHVLAMAALFVLWKQMGWPFWFAFERCLVVGVAVYTMLAAAAAVLLTLARVQPFALLMGHVTRMVSVVIFGTRRYVHGLGIIKSAALLALLYVAASVLVRRVERRARQRMQI